MKIRSSIFRNIIDNQNCFYAINLLMRLDGIAYHVVANIESFGIQFDNKLNRLKDMTI